MKESRILEFGSVTDQSETLPRTLVKMYWPADAFRVTFPIPADATAEMNVFERLILRLLEQGVTRTEEALSKEACLDEDFVRIVVRQLMDKGFLDASFRPDTNVLQKLNVTSEHKELETFATAVVFRERLRGKLLPYIHIVTDETPLRNAASQEMRNGEIDLSQFVGTANYMPPGKEEVRTLIRSLNTLSRMSGRPRIKASIVNIGTNPETVLLQCPLVFDDSRPLVANPFGAGYSAVLGVVLSDCRRSMAELDRMIAACESRFSCSSFYAKEISGDRVSRETRQRYPKLADSIRRSVLTSANVYHALEWALFYASLKISVEEALFLIKEAIRQDELPDRLAEAASRLGFILNTNNERKVRFAPVPPGKILDYRSGKSDMNTVIAISLFQADIYPVESPFALMSRKIPDFFQRLQRLRAERNPQQHGEKRGSEKKDTSEWVWVAKAIQILLPDADMRSDTPAGMEIRHDIDGKIGCRMRLQARFGFSHFSRLTETEIMNIVTATQNAEVDVDDADRQPFATGICNALESLLKRRIQSVDFRNSMTTESFDAILSARTESLDLSRVLSRSCFRIQAHNRVRAASCDPPTLGACILSFVAREDEDVLRTLTNVNPRWVETVADLLDLRGHGNEPRPLPKASIITILDQSLSLIQNLMEVLPWQ